MQYKILKDFPGSNDGLSVRDYRKGEIAELSDDLGEIALNAGYAKLIVKEKKAEAKPVKAKKK